MKRFWKGLLIGTIVFVLLISVVGIAWGLFSTTVRGKESVLQAGTLQIEIVGEPVNLNNITPGSQGEALFEVHNTGTLPAMYTVNWETSGKLFEGSHPVELWSLERGRIEPGEIHYIAVTWNFPEQSGNFYQGASGTFAPVVNAQQDVGGYP